MAAKLRPVIVISREDPDAQRALAVCIPLTTQIRGGNYEVPVPRVRWLPGAELGVGNVLGITSIEFHRLTRRAGRFESTIIKQMRNAVAWMLEIEKPQ